MKILLVVPPNIRGLLPLIPIGLIYIGANLDKHGIEYDFLDLNFANIHSLVIKLEQFKPDFVGITIRNIAETNRMNGVYQSIRNIVALTQKVSKVILGGAGFSIFPDAIMQMTQADYGIAGPGETGMIHLIDNSEKIQKGTIITKCDKSFETSDITNALKKYWQIYGKYFVISQAAIPVQATRGCKYRCSYCTYPVISGYSVQRRPINRIIIELKNIMDLTKRNYFYFVDSIFNMELHFTKDLLRQMNDSGIKLTWSCCISPADFDEEMIELMKKAGCVHCEVGIDSFSDRQLEILHKNFSAKQAKELLKELEKKDLSYSIALILGGFGETEYSLMETLREAGHFKSAQINAFIGERIYPGTSLEQMINKDKANLWKADNNSIYVEDSVVSLLKSVIQKSSPEQWSFAGELL